MRPPATVDRLASRAIRAAYARQMALPVQRPVQQQFTCEVTRVARPAPHVTRITLSAPDLGRYRRLAADEYLGLMMPRPGQRLHLPDRLTTNPRADVAAIPAGQRPDLRWYSLRALRPEEAELDLDIVLHGDSGPGSAWASRAAVGDRAGVRAGSGAYTVPVPCGPQVLVADETGYPALCAIGDHLRATGSLTSHLIALVEAPDEEHLDRIELPFRTHYRFRGEGRPGSRIVPADDAPASSLATALGLDETGLGFPDPPRLTAATAWICAEAATVAALRSRLVTAGMQRRSIFASGYWRLGKPRP